ncbi:MAG TPA: TIGR03088 family PEP-CTERM/XrtA system glycosyltransferase [Gammaproteobacteria bacterium]|nr:TIGR03088 family PEP-CTERM/XrtA system glycosyltransferase [Gammaproteobacteria bacterium]
MAPPLVAHVIYRLQVGGLENGLVNLINHMDPARYEHLIVSLTDATEFRCRIRRPEVEVIELNKRPGHDWRLYLRLYRLFRERRPAIVHSRNLAALEAQVPAALAGVPARVHGEHGWDIQDLDGMRYRRWKRMLRPFVHHYVALSKQIEDYLKQQIGVPENSLTRILNGVDVGRFRPLTEVAEEEDPRPGRFRECFCIGTVGRLEEVKNQGLLLDAFIRLRQRYGDLAERACLMLIGDGSLRPELERQAKEGGVQEAVWFAGSREDVPALMRRLDLFVLPSRAEGISNTIMEAMASGVPVVATDVGGNAELVVTDETGQLVPPEDVDAMADALCLYLSDTGRSRAQGKAARRRAESCFSLPGMVDKYMQVYDHVRAMVQRHKMASREAG